MNFKKWRFKAKTLVCIIAIILLCSHLNIHSQKPVKNITIFVHGTLMPGLALLNPLKTYNQTISTDDRYYKCLKKLREDPELYEDSIMLEEGLKKIDSSILHQYSQFNLTPAYSKKGAYQAIGAYDMLLKTVNNNSTVINDYYTYGFSGILSDLYRKEAGHKFYQELINIINLYYQQGYKPELTICGYSHGGNVVLYLADAENIYKQNLKINNIVLFGTPIQEETAIFAEHDMFKNIYNFYSEGDKVQNNDSLSTASSTSFRTFKELYNYNNISLDNIKNNSIDIKLLAHDNPTRFGHFSFWFFNKYNDNWILKNNSEDETVCNALDPLPLVILTPIFLDLLNNLNNNIKYKQLDISIRSENNITKIVALDADTKKTIKESTDISLTLNKVQKYAQVSWKPYVQTSETTRIGVGLLAAIQSLIT